LSFLPLLILAVGAQLSDDHHYDTKFQDVTSHQKIEMDYQVQKYHRHRFLQYGGHFGNGVFGSGGLGSGVFDSDGFGNGIFSSGGFGNDEFNNLGLGSSGLGSSGFGSSGLGSSGFSSSGFGGLRGSDETTSKSPTKSPLSLPTTFPSSSSSDSEENPPSSSTSSSTEFSLCDPDDPNPSVMIWKTDIDFPIKCAMDFRFTFDMIDMYGFEFCNVDDVEYKVTFSIGSEGEWTTGYVGSMDQELRLKGIKFRSTGKIKENNIGLAVIVDATDSNGKSFYKNCNEGYTPSCDFFTDEHDGKIQKLYIDRFIVYPYFTGFPEEGYLIETYPSNFLSNIQDSYCDPDDTGTSPRLLVMGNVGNETSLTNTNLHGFWNRDTAWFQDNIYGFEFCGGYLEYKASFADTAETEWTTTGFVGFRDKARPLKSISIRPSGRSKANNFTFRVVILTRQTDLGHTVKECTEGSYCSFTGDNHGWDPVYIHNIHFHPSLEDWSFDRQKDMSDYDYAATEKYSRAA